MKFDSLTVDLVSQIGVGIKSHLVAMLMIHPPLGDFSFQAFLYYISPVLKVLIDFYLFIALDEDALLS